MAFADLRTAGYRDWRLWIIIALIVISLLLEILVHWYLGVEVVYSHFFYIPVVLAAIWYGKRAVFLALFLGIAHVTGTYFVAGTLESGAVIRAMMFVLVALVIGIVSDMMRKEQEKMINEVADAALQSGAAARTPGATLEELRRRVVSTANVKRLREERDVRGLIKALHHRDPGIQYEAVEALGEIGDPAAVGPLMAALQGDPCSGIRWKAAEALARIGPAAVPDLIRAIQNPDEDIRWKAAIALGETGDIRGVEPLISLLADDDRFVRSRAAYALGLMGKTATEPLVRALSEGDENRRWGAAVALGKVHDPRAVQPLILALGDSSERVRQESAASLSAMRDDAFAPLVASLQDPSPVRRAGVVRLLGSMGNLTALGPLEELREKTDPDLREIIDTAISEIKQAQTP